jgi:Zn ribbon nucleic-acid-binding protein
MEPPCSHQRTAVIARRDGVDYVRCLDCHQILEAEDVESPEDEEDEEQSA